MNYSKKVLVTGATGLIGKELIEPLKEAGFEIYAISTKERISCEKIKYIKANLHDHTEIDNIMAKIKPEYLLHLAWCVTGYFNDNLNFDFLVSSINLLKSFHKHGGKRAIMTGTYAEYGENCSLLDEEFDTRPMNLYSKCKNHLNKIATDYSNANNLSFGWARIFSAYGFETDKRRLTADVIEHLKNNEEVYIKSGSLIRDYIYVKDVSYALVKFLDSNVEGAVNICSGEGTSIKDYVLTIAKIMEKEGLIKFNEQQSNQQNIVVGKNIRLTKEIGYKLKYSLEDGIKEILEEYYD